MSGKRKARAISPSSEEAPVPVASNPMPPIKVKLGYILANVVGAYEIPRFLAPYLVWNDAYGAAVMRQQDKGFKDAIDPLILKFNKQFNELWEWQQKTHKDWRGGRAPVEGEGLPVVDMDTNADERLAARKKAHEDAMRKFNGADNARFAFADFVLKAFGVGSEQVMLKAEELLVHSAAHDELNFGPDSNQVYRINELTNSFYLTFATKQMCQLHAHQPHAMDQLWNGVCEIATNGASLEIMALPSVHRSPTVVLSCPQCMNKHCVPINCLSGEPFTIAGVIEPSFCSTKLEQTLSDHMYNGLEVARSMLRQVGISKPFSINAIQAKVEFAEGNAMSLFEKRPNSRMGSTFVNKARPTLLVSSPAINPKTITLQSALGLSAKQLLTVAEDVNRNRQWQHAVMLYANEKRVEMYEAQFISEILQDPDTRMSVDPSSLTLEIINDTFPGVTAIFTAAFKKLQDRNSMHMLDDDSTRDVAKAIGMLIGPLTRYDRSITSYNASGWAYMFVSGLAAHHEQIAHLGGTNNVLNLSVLRSNVMLSEWVAFVTAAHVFDAVEWQEVGIRKCTVARAGSSHNDATRSTSPFEWYINMSGGQISGAFEFPRTRPAYERIRSHAVARMSELGWNANFPRAPTTLQILTLAPDSDTISEHVMNFMNVTIQQLACFPPTRSQALNLLVANRVSDFVDAVQAAQLDASVVASLGNVAISTEAEGPM